MSEEKCVMVLILQSASMSTFCAFFAQHLRTPLQYLGPLYKITAMFALAPSVENASTKYSAALISAFQPDCPRLPLPSRRKTTSSSFLHFNEGQRMLLHGLYCNRSFDHAPGHLPCPSGDFMMCFVRLRVPPSQSLEHQVHLLHSLNSQSDSHDWPLQDRVCDVWPHGFPPYAMALRTSRKRCCTPPPHSALHLLQPVQADTLQSTGHGWRLHFLIAAKGKHFAPPSG